MSDTTTPAPAPATVAVTYLGHSYSSFPASLEDASGDVIDAIDDQKLSHALRALMSPAEWAAFKATKPKTRDYAGLFDAYAASIGLVNAGE